MDDEKRFTVSVIICAYTINRWTQLKAAVESVKQQDQCPDEIILIVDHNSELLDMARREFAGIVVIASEGAPGLSGARNTGIIASNGSIVAFMDDDAYAERDWLMRLIEPYDDERVLGVGGHITAKWASSRPRWFPDEFDWVVGCSYRGLPNQRAQVRNLIGCNMSFRREVFQVAGGMRSGIGRTASKPLGCEETELCIRAEASFFGKHFVYDPRARVHHEVPAARGTWRYFRSRCLAEGQSKAVVSLYSGTKKSLSNELRYSLVTLPLGVLRGVSDALAKGDAWGLCRSGAIVTGLALTSAGYFKSRALQRLRSAPLEAAPVLVPQVEEA